MPSDCRVLKFKEPPEFCISVLLKVEVESESCIVIVGAVDETAKAASSYAVDISAYFQGEEQSYGDVDGRWRAGMIIQNLGPKIKYDAVSYTHLTLPTNREV